ncbi:hypothetical protein PthstB1num2_09580 [Parageobacillus thermoglucosidasius]|nr:hypothetical protein B4168_0150 [Anoxybacillus flavithermus]OAO88928.1 hypothetical protein GT23_0168 [Parageobacillus thermoglucosidasius]GMN98918.1 hypothetical protein PthstB1num2_09580 [Parageobacillus thermoglucosidasius]
MISEVIKRKIFIFKKWSPFLKATFCHEAACGVCLLNEQEKRLL